MSTRRVTIEEFLALAESSELLAEYADAAPAWAPQAVPRLDIYRKAESLGMYDLFVCEGTRLLGFAGVLTTPSLHYGTALPYVEALFSRSSGAGVKLLQHITAYFKGRGFDEVRVTCGVPGSAADKLVDRLGGEPCTIVRRLVLD